MRRISKPQRCVRLQEGTVELKFPVGDHPSEMTEEEFKHYWAWYNCEVPSEDAIKSAIKDYQSK